ncbi:MAG: GNAT family N-acetyltransferase [Candidatus Hodarchaeales archaeon]|jgi:ribosomal protein S18 acetylase RimI-like enzyme
MIRSSQIKDIPFLVRIPYHFSTERIWKLETSINQEILELTLKNVKLDYLFTKKYEINVIDLEKKLEINLSEGWVFEEENHIIGFIFVEIWSWNDILYVSELCIHPDWRKKGIGHLLLNKAREKAKQMNKRGLLIETQNVNYGAIAFYLKNGCKLVGCNSALYAPPHDEEFAVYFFLEAN